MVRTSVPITANWVHSCYAYVMHKLMRWTALALAMMPHALLGSGSMGFTDGARSRMNYNAGRQVYMQRVACASCPHPDRFADHELARQLLDDHGFLATLETEEREALQVYLRTRFQIDLKLVGS